MSTTRRSRWITSFVAVPVLVLLTASANFAAELPFPARELETFRFTEPLRTTGELGPRRDLTMKSEISEEVVELPVDEGETVIWGVLLLHFDTDLLKVRLDRARHREARARHQHNLARKDFNRKQLLLDIDLVSKATVSIQRLVVAVKKLSLRSNRPDPEPEWNVLNSPQTSKIHLPVRGFSVERCFL